MAAAEFIQHLLVQAPIVAFLIIFMVLDRREHTKTVDALRSENKALEDLIVSRIDLLISLQKRGD